MQAALMDDNNNNYRFVLHMSYVFFSVSHRLFFSVETKFYAPIREMKILLVSPWSKIRRMNENE